MALTIRPEPHGVEVDRGSAGRWLPGREDLQELVARGGGRLTYLPAGGTLIEHGARERTAWLVVAGLLEARQAGTEAFRLGWSGRGLWLGERAALTGEPRSATVKAWRDSVLLSVSGEALWRLLADRPDRLAEMLVLMDERARAPLQPRPGAFVVGLLVQPGAAAVEPLVGELRAAGHTVLTEPDAALEPAGLARLLDEQAHAGSGIDAVVLIGRADQGDWARFITRNADRVGWVGREGAPPDTGRRRDVLWCGAPTGVELDLGGSGVVQLVRDLSRDVRVWLEAGLERWNAPDPLSGFRLFAGMDVASRAVVAEQADWTVVQAGEVVVEEGVQADAAWLVRSGRLRVTRGGRVVTHFTAGDAFGELGLVLDGTRSATVTALRPSEIGRIDRAVFEELRGRLPAFESSITDNLARIITRPPPTGVPTPPSTLALVSLHDHPRARIAARAIVEDLAEAGLSAFVVDEARIAEHVGPPEGVIAPDSLGHRQLMDWLERLEKAVDVVLLTCTATPDPWSLMACSHADEIVWVAASEEPPALRELEVREAGSGRPAHLLLLQPGGIEQASGTAAWLDLRPGTQVHHWREGRPDDLAAALRRILQRATGLALAGAANRAPAHVGTAMGMADLGMRFDILSGTSSGAGIAALLATGIDLEDAAARCVELVTGATPRWFELQPPITAITSGVRFDRFLQGVYGDRMAEDQIIPCRASAIDLKTHQLVWIDRGPLWRLLRISGSIPMLYPPVVEGGRVLVDGGLLQYIPLDGILPTCHRGICVASNLENVELDVPFPLVREYGSQVSGWGQLWRGLTGQSTRGEYPGLVDILFNSMVIAGVQADRARVVPDTVCEVRSPFPSAGLFAADQEIAAHNLRLTRERTVEQLGAWMQARAPTCQDRVDPVLSPNRARAEGVDRPEPREVP